MDSLCDVTNVANEVDAVYLGFPRSSDAGAGGGGGGEALVVGGNHDDRYVALYQRAQFVTGVLCFPIVCLFGLSGNLLSMVVLSHPRMQTPTNVYLTSLAVSDSIKLINDVLYFVSTLLIELNPPLGNQLLSTLYPFAHYFFSMTVLCTAWLTVGVAAERYMLVCRPLLARRLCNFRSARIVCVSTFLITAALSLPMAFRYRSHHATCNETTHYVKVALTDLWRNTAFSVPYTWLHNMMRTFVPLCVVTAMNCFIIRALRSPRHLAASARGRQGSLQRVSVMLVSVIVLFVLCVTPDAVMSTVFGYGYVESSYLVRAVREVTDLLLLVNSAANFVLYCSFNYVFRKNFVALFCGLKKSNEPGLPNGATCRNMPRRQKMVSDQSNGEHHNDGGNAENTEPNVINGSPATNGKNRFEKEPLLYSENSKMGDNVAMIELKPMQAKSGPKPEVIDETPEIAAEPPPPDYLTFYEEELLFKTVPKVARHRRVESIKRGWLRKLGKSYSLPADKMDATLTALNRSLDERHPISTGVPCTMKPCLSNGCQGDKHVTIESDQTASSSQSVPATLRTRTVPSGRCSVSGISPIMITNSGLRHHVISNVTGGSMSMSLDRLSYVTASEATPFSSVISVAMATGNEMNLCEAKAHLQMCRLRKELNKNDSKQSDNRSNENNERKLIDNCSVICNSIGSNLVESHTCEQNKGVTKQAQAGSASCETAWKIGEPVEEMSQKGAVGEVHCGPLQLSGKGVEKIGSGCDQDRVSEKGSNGKQDGQVCTVPRQDRMGTNHQCQSDTRVGNHSDEKSPIATDLTNKEVIKFKNHTRNNPKGDEKGSRVPVTPALKQTTVTAKVKGPSIELTTYVDSGLRGPIRSAVIAVNSEITQDSHLLRNTSVGDRSELPHDKNKTYGKNTAPISMARQHTITKIPQITANKCIKNKNRKLACLSSDCCYDDRWETGVLDHQKDKHKTCAASFRTTVQIAACECDVFQLAEEEIEHFVQ